MHVRINSAGLRRRFLHRMEFFTIPNHFSAWQLVSFVMPRSANGEGSVTATSAGYLSRSPKSTLLQRGKKAM